MELKKMQIIIFKLRNKYYAVGTDKVEEITKTTNSTNVPNAPEWVEGLINLRGNVISLIDLGFLLKVEEPLSYNNIIICHNEEEKIGLLVEEIIGVREIEPSMINKVNQSAQEGILGIVQLEEFIANIIDVDMLLDSK